MGVPTIFGVPTVAPYTTNISAKLMSCNSVCMQGSVTAILVNWFASCWQGYEDPAIIKIIKRRYLAGMGCGAEREGLDDAFPFNFLYHCVYYLN